MRRIQVFIIVFTVSLGVIFALLAVGVYLAAVQPTQYSSSWVGQMWSGMGNRGMGGMMGSGKASTASYFWIIPAALIGIAVVGGVGLAFYLAFPEIRTMKETVSVSNNEPNSLGSKPILAKAADVSSEDVNPYELISRTMTPDEKKVLDVLSSHNGKYLQKYIKNETGLSRLQTHRIVARLADRGVVSVKQVGNTNEVLISDWLKSCRVQKTA